MTRTGESRDDFPPLIAKERGVLVNLYHYLWLQSPKTGRSCHIHLPPTIIYSGGKPTAWYFTSHKERRILRKNRDNVLESEIAKLFTTEKQSEVAAWFAGQTHNVTKVRTKKQPSDIFGAIELDDCPQRHFSQARVAELVYPAPYGRRYGDQLHEGALQVFVEPREAQDSILRLIWTPAGCVCEKRTNKHELVPAIPIADVATTTFHTAASAAAPPPSIDQRIASFGTLDQKQPPLLGPTGSVVGSMLHHCHEFVTVHAIKMRLEEFGDNIANHLYEISRETTSVTRMELFFKIDKENRIWFLFCDSLLLNSLEVPPSPSFPSTQTSTQKSPKPPMAMISSPRKEHASSTLPASFSSGESETHQGPPRPSSAYPRAKTPLQVEDLLGDIECPLTLEVFPKSQRIQVTFKLIILHWLRLCIDPPPGESRDKYNPDAIPPALLRAHPSLSQEHFSKMRTNDMFLLGTLFVSPAGARELSRASLDDLTESFGRSLRKQSTQTSSSLNQGASWRRRTDEGRTSPPPRASAESPRSSSLPVIRNQSASSLPARHETRPSSSNATLGRSSTDVPSRKGQDGKTSGKSSKDYGWTSTGATTTIPEDRLPSTPEKKELRVSTTPVGSSRNVEPSSPWTDNLPSALRPKSVQGNSVGPTPDRSSLRSSQAARGSNNANHSTQSRNARSAGGSRVSPSGWGEGGKARPESPMPLPPSRSSPARPVTSEEKTERSSKVVPRKVEVKEEPSVSVATLQSSTTNAIKLYAVSDDHKEKLLAAQAEAVKPKPLQILIPASPSTRAGSPGRSLPMQKGLADPSPPTPVDPPSDPSMSPYLSFQPLSQRIASPTRDRPSLITSPAAKSTSAASGGRYSPSKDQASQPAKVPSPPPPSATLPPAPRAASTSSPARASSASPSRSPAVSSKDQTASSKDRIAKHHPPSNFQTSSVRQSTPLAPIAESKAERQKVKASSPTTASAATPLERKSVTRLNDDELLKLKELSESSRKAEVVTAQLLAEAQGLLAEGVSLRGSRPSSSALVAREKAKIVNSAGPPEANLTADEEEELSEALMG